MVKRAVHVPTIFKHQIWSLLDYISLSDHRKKQILFLYFSPFTLLPISKTICLTALFRKRFLIHSQEYIVAQKVA